MIRVGHFNHAVRPQFMIDFHSCAFWGGSGGNSLDEKVEAVVTQNKFELMAPINLSV